jgi:hypothetical protein
MYFVLFVTSVVKLLFLSVAALPLFFFLPSGRVLPPIALSFKKGYS